MNLQSVVNLHDLQRLARRKLPRIAFDFIEGGADDEQCLARNRTAFEAHRLVPRYLTRARHDLVAHYVLAGLLVTLVTTCLIACLSICPCA